ncbi:DUF2235 domain-containing protein [Marinicella sp. W31]|uniref:DUF2235 domain-containing protein n=1 Tax=Marinicella sp. W31 TaxID=3023713 RepID=UPI0037579EAD
MADKKNIILCSDGTGQVGGRGNDTNVWRIYDAVNVNDADYKQVTFYDDGVGTDNNLVTKSMGLAFGWGLSRNIRELYKFLVMQYNPGDRIYAFGFSRGAHTIRLLVEMICNFGILDRKRFANEHSLDQAILDLSKQFKSAIREAWLYKVLRIGEMKSSEQLWQRTMEVMEHKTDTFNPEKRNKNSDAKESNKQHHQNVQIEFLGVWDTVSAIGMPVDELRENIFFAHHAFVDNLLNPQVKHACHALAIDEARHTFKPVLWDQSKKSDQKRIEQVWFAGVHTNVGGGYAKDQLAMISLEWMMCKASEHGLRFREPALRYISDKANLLGKLYNSRAGIQSLYRYKPRDITELMSEAYGTEKLDISTIQIHDSVYQRISNSSAEYSPPNLPKQTQVISNDYACISSLESNNEDEIELKTKTLEKITTKTPEKKVIDAERDNPAAIDNPWNVIWWQKVMHLSFFIFFLTFYFYGKHLTTLAPLIHTDSSHQGLQHLYSLLAWLSKKDVFYIGNDLIPGYTNHPYIFAVFAFVFMSMMWFRQTLKKHLNNISNVFWSEPPFDEYRVESKRLETNFILKGMFKLADWIRNLRWLNHHLIPWIRSKILPILVSSLILILIIILLAYFTVPDMLQHVI